MRKAALATSLILVFTLPTQAGVIERACLDSGRAAASRLLCGCIQQVADLTLEGAEQRKAARFFKDPHRAQEVRQSSNNNDRRFWDRYKAFGAAAQTYCS